MKTILIPTDFSNNAWNAMKYAAGLFEEEVCKYILLNTYYAATPTIDVINTSYIEPFTKASKEGLEFELKRFKELKHHSNTWFETESAYGDLLGVVERLSNEQSIDYIVMGTKGASGIRKVIMGSNTVSVIKEVKPPVICVPERASFNTLKKVVFATDYRAMEDDETLEPLKYFVDQYNAEIAILNVRSEEDLPVTIDEAEEGFTLHGYFEGAPHDFYNNNNEKVEEGIQEFARNHQADMVALLKREHSFFERMFMDGISDKVAFQSTIPLLVMQERKL